MNLNFTNFLSFTVTFFFTFALTKLEASSTTTKFNDVIEKIKLKSPVYSTVCLFNGTETPEKIKKKLEDAFNSAENDGEVDKFPHKRSALHRAIEQMNPTAVEWLLKNGARCNYGTITELGSDYGTPLPVKERYTQPAHLIGHLEEYYRADKKSEAHEILTLLNNRGLNVLDWPAKNGSEFYVSRIEWGTTKGFNTSTFAVDDTSGTRSRSSSTSSDGSSP